MGGPDFFYASDFIDVPYDGFICRIRIILHLLFDDSRFTIIADG